MNVHPTEGDARTGQQHADSNGDSNTAAHRRSAARHDTQRRSLLPSPTGAVTRTDNEQVRGSSPRQAHPVFVQVNQELRDPQAPSSSLLSD
jgi:hypothetical protein